MIRKTGLALLVVLPLLGAIIWINRLELILGLVKLQTLRSYEVAPNREVIWQQGPEQTSTSAPNVIVIVADDLGINDISTFGGGHIATPSIDALAAAGANFIRAYSGAASCAPSRAMLMTGRYPTRTGFEFTPTPTGMAPIAARIANASDSGLPPVLIRNADREGGLPFEQQGLPPSEITLAEVLKARGYHTGHIGKWHLGRLPGYRPQDQGFDESLMMHSGLYLPEDHPDVVNAKLDFDPLDKFYWAKMRYAASFTDGGPMFAPKGYLTDYWTDESINFIRANRHRPFFLYLAHWGPHAPLQATREDYKAVGDIQPHRKRVYAAMIRALDRSVGHIMATLAREGLADNTLVVFTSDNGGTGYIGIPDINAPYRGWKLNLFEGGIRVPLFMSWPAKIQAGQEIATPASHIDFLPTLASAVGADVPQDRPVDGADLLPLAMGSADAWTRDTLFWQSGDYQVVRHKHWKLQLSGQSSKAWLFDLQADPTERNNLAAERPDIVAQLSALNEKHQSDRVPPLYPHVLKIPVAVDKTLAEKVQPGDEVVYWPN